MVALSNVGPKPKLGLGCILSVWRVGGEEGKKSLASTDRPVLGSVCGFSRRRTKEEEGSFVGRIKHQVAIENETISGYPGK
jgi:hypothetical protein